MRGHALRIPPRRVFAILAAALAVVTIVALGRGAVSISPREIIAALGDTLGVDLGEVSANKLAILGSIRLPRVVLAIVVGAALGCAGAALQGIVRNPLADPRLVGVSDGAALGTIAWLVIGPRLVSVTSVWPGAVAAFGGAIIATSIAIRLARVDGRISGTTLLVAGVGLAALSSSGYGSLLYIADDATLRSITFWTLGSLGGATWPVVAAAAMPITIALVLLPRLTRDLDRLALGEIEARHLGVDVGRVITRGTVLACLAVGASVATCGVIGFVGLVVPYLVRGVLGPSHTTMLPASALGGAVLLVTADLIARTVVAPSELPVGIVTAVLGAPVLLALVRRGRAVEVMP